MLASVFIIAVSLVLLLYWFRYTCLLLLENNPASEFAGSMARVNRLSFPQVQKALASGVAAGAGLDDLHRSLESDYRILLYLLQHSAGIDLPGLEHRLLVLDYRVMQLWYRVTRHASPERARVALVEMARVVGYFSQKMGERVAQHPASA